MRERSNAIQMVSPSADSEGGGPTGNGVGVGVELLQLRGGAVQCRLQLFEFGGSRRDSEETLRRHETDATERHFRFSQVASTRVSVPRLKKCRDRSGPGEGEEAEEKADVVDGESRGRRGSLRTRSGGVSINTTNASLKGLPPEGSFVNTVKLRSTTVDNKWVADVCAGLGRSPEPIH